MRIVPFAISAIITAGLVYVLNNPLGSVAPFAPGRFLSPQHGFWQNAEPADANFSEELDLAGMKGKAEIYFDERLVPHVFAENDDDLYFIQGYLHARFRLFQMDLSTKAAEGRASEIAGDIAINHDKEKRRLGMKYAAQNALKTVESDPASKAAFDAYTNGVNAYINSLTESSLPFEYKLLNFKPEKWTNLRTALLLKMMAEMLSSDTEKDLMNTNAKAIFTEEELKLIYPQVPDSLLPIVPKGTAFAAPGIVPVKPVTADSLYFGRKDLVANTPVTRQDPNNGSNNWVVGGIKTQSGAPILCNDPHLELSLPSIWYEMQLTSPTCNVYGVSLPGSPFVIIGFNDSIAWGVTNAQRDVKDYYEIKFKDDTKKEYWFNGGWQPTTETRVEEIKVKGGKTVYDTVAYTIFGPVMYDGDFQDEFSKERTLAVRWVAHDPSNEGNTFYKLNRAKNYTDYEDAIKTFDCPGQNFVFASRSGDIALWQQGKFPARWDRQGLYVMPGDDSSYMWQGFIPQGENPHAMNPERGFLQSANQRPADSTYPYFIPGSYITPRGRSIEQKLSAMNGITPTDMMKLQNDYFNTQAQDISFRLLYYVRQDKLTADAKRYLDMIMTWGDFNALPNSKAQTVYQCWWDSTEAEIWRDDLTRIDPQAPWPDDQTTIELIIKDSALKYADNINTPEVETLHDVVTNALNKAAVGLKEKETKGNLEWSKFKNPTIYHLLKNRFLPFARTNLPVGGSGNIINAITHSHGPSWRMIVHLTTPAEAYGVYPAGQSGNPGSKYYDNFVDTWVAGQYYVLWFMREGDKTDKKVKWVMKLNANRR
jgi:penicillin G amidase